MNELQANPLRPKQVKDPNVRKALGELVCSMIDDGQSAKGTGLQQRWEDCERRYRGEPDKQGLMVNEDAQPVAINIVKPGVDALVTKVCNPITSQRPYFSAFGYQADRNRLKMNEDVVQFLIERADFARKFRTATRLSCQAAPAIFRVTFSIQDNLHLADHTEESQDIPAPFKYIGPRIDVIHPNDFFLYPLTAGGVHEARAVGHRFAKRCREVKEKQKLGEYFDNVTIYGGDDPQSWESGRASDWSLTNEASGITDADDQMVELWEVIVKHDLDNDGFEERYRAVVAKTSRVLLEWEKYGVFQEEVDEFGSVVEEFVPYSRPWYYQHAVTLPAHNEFFHANPIIQDLIPIQGAYSDGMTLMLEGGKMSAFKAAFIQGGKISDRVKRFRPGEYHYIESDAKITFAESQFDPSVWPLLFQILKDDRDAILRMGKNQTAQSTGGTASEAVITNNNAEEGADEYRDVAALAPEEMCDFIRELAFIHYSLLKGVYGAQFPCEDSEALRAPLRWEATGKTSDTSPQIMGQNVQEILALLQNPIALQALSRAGINLPALLKGWLKTKRWPVADSDLFQDELIAQPLETVDPLGAMGAGGGLPAGPLQPNVAGMPTDGAGNGADPGAGGMPFA